MKTGTKITAARRFKNNPRAISEKQLKSLGEDLEQLGDLSGIVYCRKQKAYVGGNQRSLIMDGAEVKDLHEYPKRQDDKTIATGYVEWKGRRFAYREVEFTKAEFNKAAIVANAAGGEFDFEILGTEYWKDQPIGDWGVDLPDDWGKVEPEPEDEGSAAILIDRAAELQKIWKIAPGQLWQLGDHRILCGDSTKREDVERLMDGSKADMVFTDPPYGIKRDKGFGGAEAFGGKGKPIPRRQHIGEWDSDRPRQETFDVILTLAKTVLIFGGNYFADLLPQGNHWIVWDKKNTMPTFGDCELVWTNVPRDSVKIREFEYNGLIGKEKERFHATQKPLKLIVDMIADYSESGSLVDPFLGSGSTLIACEQLNRKCYGMEIAPEYIAVTLERWHNYTGKTPTLIKDGR